MLSKSKTFDIIVLGAGIAGISAAVHCIGRGLRPLVIESTSNVGGRARSFIDRVSGDMIDNGQHVMMGCYDSFFEVLRLLGTFEKVKKQEFLTIPFHFPDGRRDLLHAKGIGNVHGPLGMALGFLRLSILSRKEKASLLIFAMRVKWNLCKPGLMTAMELLLSESQSQRIIDLVWSPVILATMNGKPEEVSAKIFINVLRLAFFGKGDSSSLYIPQCGLSELFEPFGAWLEKHDGMLIQSNGVEKLVIENDEIQGVYAQDGMYVESKYVISGIPPHALLKILPDAHKTTSFFSSFDSIRYSPIISLYLWFDKSFPEIDIAAIMESSTQWIFRKSTVMQHGKSMLALTISAGDEIVSMSTEEIALTCSNEIRQCFPEMVDAQLLHWKVIKERMATVLIDPDTEESRPDSKTPIKGLLLAGDWTNTGLPATLEGAALSGKVAASLV
ncbi:MAG: hydroxysqualene dehydroxylase HpnE [Candidatus Kapaibacteriota bacterium]